jgi:hypothetical protein
MRSVLISFLIGTIVSIVVSSCATLPTKPLAPGELRLLSTFVPEKENIRVNLPFVVNISFEADGKPEIRTACFEFSGDGPYCFKAIDVNYGSPGTIKVKIHTKNPGSRLLETYVIYIRGEKIQLTNVVRSHIRVNP